MLTSVALVVCQVSVVEPPLSTVSGLAVSVAVGAAVAAEVVAVAALLFFAGAKQHDRTQREDEGEIPQSRLFQFVPPEFSRILRQRVSMQTVVVYQTYQELTS